MYFSEFLETCTIRWVSFCKGEVGMAGETPFLFWSEETALTGRGWAAAVYPAGVPLHTPAHPDGIQTAGSSASRARTRAGKYQGRPCHDTPGRWTRCTGLRSIPGRPRRNDRGGAVGWRACAVCPIGHAQTDKK